ncbi:MAG: ornithine cyclodeaminase family protein [Lachnospiraceae bacterium]|nr:ornithine cyclodeaminase family protein [Lachnospiraceae bacterium]
MYIFDQKYVEEHLTTDVCLKVMEEVLKEERQGTVTQYLRTAIPLPNTNILGIMPGYADKGYFGAKILSVYHTNGGSGYPSHQGEILLFGKEHGEVLAIVDAMSVTKIRTGAVSAVASVQLARKDAEKLAILGCGAQGRSHLEAMSEAFALKTVYTWDVCPEAAESLAEAVRKKGMEGISCDTVEEAVREADIICTVTPSKTPILKGAWVKPGTHINAVGACAPADRELDSDLSAQGHFFGDNIDSVLHESGDFLIPQKEGRYGEEHLAGVIGDVLLGRQKGRSDENEITIFEALGMAVEDIACAIFLYEQAKEAEAK